MWMCRFIIAGQTLRDAVVPGSARAFDFAEEYRLSYEKVGCADGGDNVICTSLISVLVFCWQFLVFVLFRDGRTKRMRKNIHSPLD